LLLEFVENFVLLLDDFLDVLGGFEKFPLVCEFKTGQLNVKFVEDTVDLHCVIDLALELFDLNTDFGDELLGVG
jgi:hypothetical protein